MLILGKYNKRKYYNAHATIKYNVGNYFHFTLISLFIFQKLTGPNQSIK